MTLDLFNDILFWIFLYLLLWQAYILLFNRGVPNIKTPQSIRLKIIERLKNEQGPKTSFNIVDLGAANGTFSRLIARAMPQAKIHAIEISPLAHIRGTLITKFKNIPNLEHVRKDFNEYDFSNTDAVVLYLTADTAPLAGKLLREKLPKGALIISNRFQLWGDWKPIETVQVKTILPHEGTFFTYRA